MKIVGLSAFYHEAAACVLVDGRLVAAAPEERFTRVKHDPRLPVNAYRYCLQEVGISPADVDAVAFYESPAKKLERQHWSGVAMHDADAGSTERAIREHLGFDGPVLYFDHHQSHAASAFHFSGFDEAAILTVDGVGEWATATYGRARGTTIDLFEEVDFPHSLGLWYATITAYLGFAVNDGEYKVMGLAPYGRPRFVDQMHELVCPQELGQFSLNMGYFDFVAGDTMYSERLCSLLGAPARAAGSPLEQFHCDVARSAQVVLEEMLLDKIRYLARRVGSPDLCFAGGVALNCVANGRIRREGPFERMFIPPAPGDAGACLGAAALAHVSMTGNRPAAGPMARVDLGPAYSHDEIVSMLRASGIPFADFGGREGALIDAVVERLQRGEVVGWFQGSMEFGPRALGHRSILADPTDPSMRDRINTRVKRREGFRPFAPSVLAEHAAEHFDLDHTSPFMLETCRVRSALPLAAVTHVDGSARPQTVDADANPRFASLLARFHIRTGCPLLLNTSFNLAGEPIVNSPSDALLCFAAADLDCLVMEDALVDRAALPDRWSELVEDWDTSPGCAFRDSSNPISEQLYTFV